jgi:hypothetical protein
MDMIFTSWTDSAAAITAIIAIVISIKSLVYARESLTLAKMQDERKAPKLQVAFVGGDYTVDEKTGARTYHVQLSICNLSDSDNAVTRAELRLKYRLHEGADMIVRLQQLNCGDELQLPIRISAHDAVVGWCRFLVAPEIVRETTVESYTVELTDTHNDEVSLALILMSERRGDR